MAKVKVHVGVTPTPNVTAVAIHVDGLAVPLTNDEGTLSLNSPGRYILVWHFAGNAGDALGITVEVGGKAVLSVKKSRVPDGENAGAGIARFDI